MCFKILSRHFLGKSRPTAEGQLGFGCSRNGNLITNCYVILRVYFFAYVVNYGVYVRCHGAVDDNRFSADDSNRLIPTAEYVAFLDGGLRHQNTGAGFENGFSIGLTVDTEGEQEGVLRVVKAFGYDIFRRHHRRQAAPGNEGTLLDDRSLGGSDRCTVRILLFFKGHTLDLIGDRVEIRNVFAAHGDIFVGHGCRLCLPAIEGVADSFGHFGTIEFSRFRVTNGCNDVAFAHIGYDTAASSTDCMHDNVSIGHGCRAFAPFFIKDTFNFAAEFGKFN